jgi:hypothetical protein
MAEADAIYCRMAVTVRYSATAGRSKEARTPSGACRRAQDDTAFCYLFTEFSSAIPRRSAWRAFWTSLCRGWMRDGTPGATRRLWIRAASRRTRVGKRCAQVEVWRLGEVRAFPYLQRPADVGRQPGPVSET